MKPIFRIALVGCLVCLALPVTASEKIGTYLKESSKYYESGDLQKSLLKMQQAVEEIWQESSLWIRQSLLVSKSAEGYGVYSERPNNVYEKGEPILIYLEPLGYHHQRRKDGMYEFGMRADFILKDDKGAILGGQEDFQRIAMVSHHPNQEMFLSLTYRFSGLLPGKYTIVTTIHDLHGKATTAVENPIQIR